MLHGANFGDPSLSGVARMSVNFHRSTCTLLAADCSREQRCDCTVISHTHDTIVVRAPPGIGVNHTLSVQLQGALDTLVTEELVFS